MWPRAETPIDLCRRGTHDKLIINFRETPLNAPWYLRGPFDIFDYR